MGRHLLVCDCCCFKLLLATVFGFVTMLKVAVLVSRPVLVSILELFPMLVFVGVG